MKTQQPDIASHFESLKDPRVEGKNQHLLIDIIIIAICAVVSGASGWEQIEIFGKAKQEWLSTGYSAENGQWPCRESGRCSAVKTAAIPVKTARV